MKIKNYLELKNNLVFAVECKGKFKIKFLFLKLIFISYFLYLKVKN